MVFWNVKLSALLVRNARNGRHPSLHSCIRPALRNCRTQFYSTDDGSQNVSNLPVQTDLLDKYRSLVTLGYIEYNEEQVRVVMKLRRLQKELEDYAPPALSARLFQPNLVEDPDEPWWTSSYREFESPESQKALVRLQGYAEELGALETPKGLLVTGPPGSGKSFLVDLWFNTVKTPYKARKHYNQLILEIYRGVWEETKRRMNNARSAETPSQDQRGPWNKAIREQIKGLLGTGTLPVRWSRLGRLHSTQYTDPSIAFVVAKRLLLHHWLLVFDEIQLLDVSSANLLADVLSWYWRMGGVIVGTSNKVPDELYRNGVQQERLEPFVEALKMRCPVVELDTQKDWRERLSTSQPLGHTWFTFGRRSSFEAALQKSLDGTKGQGYPPFVYTLIAEVLPPEPSSKDLHVFGRLLRVPWASGSTCKWTFEELCGQSLGAADYLTIAAHFSTVIITDIPILPLSSKDKARRFISLIDALYECRCKIICLAETTPDQLFFPDGASKDAEADAMLVETVAETQHVYRPNVSSYDQPQMQEAPAAPRAPLSIDTLSIFSGEEERFAFKRAISRLKEMTSAAYNQVDRWTPLATSARKWETSPLNSSEAPAIRVSKDSIQPEETESDFASEAANETRQHDAFDRPHAPRLSPDHIWGVRDDWGPAAKDWGKGPKIYNRRGGEAGSTPDGRG
ncbi:hypothetical protein CVT26_003729 [Gymnopilus dilepis]|uniref:AAA+ ATPase domain-containing protein n=1 Tax=Gymnopilus dilepis TaxID=231916 RepID=A0A409YXG3_9AGAR|nr:hypothetical protein CVT26_003729 [Gymnopilus dilepis]